MIDIAITQDGQSQDRVELIGLQNLDAIRGQHVLVVEDIVDTGKTYLSTLLFEHAVQFLSEFITSTILILTYRIHKSTELYRYRMRALLHELQTQHHPRSLKAAVYVTLWISWLLIMDNT